MALADGDNGGSGARHFLRTVLVVDDEADLRPPTSAPASVTVPKFGSLSQTEDTGQAERGRGVQAGVLVDGFADVGLLCSVMIPGPNGDVAAESRILKAAAVADIVVLDWELEDEGERALRIIERLVQAGDRLRMVVVYTSTPELEPLGKEIESVFEQFDVSFAKLRPGVFSAEPFFCVVLRKNGVESDVAYLQCDDSELPRVVMQQFTELTAGLLRNAVFEGLAAIRDNAHVLLSRFPPRLDAPFASHAALGGASAGADEFAVGLLARQVESLLVSCGARGALDTDKVTAWANSTLSDPCALGRGSAAVSVHKSAVVSMLELGPAGLRDVTGNQPAEKRLARGVTSLFAPTDASEQDIAAADHEMSRLACLAVEAARPYAGAPPPVLTLGTVLYEQKTGEPPRYWVCLQPRCDAVRLEDSTPFTLLPLVLDPKAPDLVVFNGHDVLLGVPPNARGLKRVKFRPTGGKVVARRQPTDWVFTSAGGLRFEWLAQLHPLHAQRIVQRIAGSFDRVGLDEYEWLRLQSSAKADRA